MCQENYEPIVCLHGSASNSGMWQEFVTAVRGRCDVVTPELLAGTSSPQEQVDALMRQLAHVAGPFHLVGHAYGATVALHVAANHPERVLSLVLYEPSDAAGLHVGAVRAPVRLLSGTRSWAAARSRIEGIAGRLSNATLLKLVGLRHLAPVTHPHLVNPVILDYVLPVSMPGPVRAA